MYILKITEVDLTMRLISFEHLVTTTQIISFYSTHFFLTVGIVGFAPLNGIFFLNTSYDTFSEILFSGLPEEYTIWYAVVNVISGPSSSLRLPPPTQSKTIDSFVCHSQLQSCVRTDNIHIMIDLLLSSNTNANTRTQYLFGTIRDT